jgi:AcrR family transcriptional regulator
MSESMSYTARQRPGTYARGADTVDQILKAALSVLINEGAIAFTLRRIARECGLKVGNLSYHFPRKEVLIQLLLEELLESYEALLDRTVRQPDLTAEDRLSLTITICLDDIGSKRTTRLFTELWALANHDAFVADRVAAFYKHVHGIIGKFVGELNPALTAEDIQIVSLFISSAMEGTTVFSGFGKAWEAQMPQIKALSVLSFVHLAKTVTSSDIRRFEKPNQTRDRPEP